MASTRGRGRCCPHHFHQRSSCHTSTCYYATGEGTPAARRPVHAGSRGTRTQGTVRAGAPPCRGVHTRQREASRCRDPALSHPESPSAQPEDTVRGERTGCARPAPRGPPAGTGGSARPPPGAATQPSVLSTVTLYRTTLWPTGRADTCRGPGRPCAQESSEGHLGPLPSPVSREAARGTCL